MSLDSKFQAASEAAESWLNTVALVARFGKSGNVEMVYTLLLPRTEGGTIPNLHDSYFQHAEILDQLQDKLAALSDGPVKWEHGRGLSAIANVPDAVFPHVWSSAHEAAAGIARLALELLARPLEGITDPAEQQTGAEQLLDRRWKALVITPDEVATLQERIRRERAKLLAHAPPPDGSGEQSVNATDPPKLKPMSPRTLLTGWHEIAAAVSMPYGRREEIKSLNKRFNGPITNAGAGTKPMVYREDLIRWWDTLALQQQELTNQREGAKMSADAQHNYGRDGTVAPEIGGGVKKRRRDKRT